MVIVPTPVPSLIAAFVGALKLTLKVSLFSKKASPLMVTLTVVVPVAPPDGIMPVPIAAT